MEAPADVSVVIPAYNAAHLLRRCVDSVLCQTEPVSEIIIVDDGSVDDTAKVVASLPGPIRLLRQRNLGVSVARNTGIREARSTWIAFLDADDRWLSNKIERQMQCAVENTDADVIYSDAEVESESGASAGTFLTGKGPAVGWVFDRLLNSCFVLPSTVLIKRDTLVRAGMFDERLCRAEDYELWLRIAANHRFAMVPDCLTIYQRQPQSVSRDDLGMSEAIVGIFDSLARRELTPSQRNRVQYRCSDALFDLSYAVRTIDSKRALLCAWRSLRMNPMRLATWRLAAMSFWFTVRAW